MTTEHQREQADRRENLENEKRLRDLTTKSTYASFAEAFADDERGGRFKQTPQHIVGSTPTPQYPAAFLQRDPVPDEPPLGVDINAMEPCGEPHEVRARLPLESASPRGVSGEPAAAPSNTPLVGVKRVGSPPSRRR